jgi:SAM-dependent methyltransferase
MRTDGGKPLDRRVLEIGCGEGGNLKPFLDRGCVCTGVDLNGPQIERAKEFFAGHPHADQLTLLHADIYDVPPDENQYDIIMLRDVIEHIHNQERLMHILPRFLKPHGVMFFAFPPWMMPFGGHQQICRSRLSKVPYIHLLPRRWYGRLLHRFGESDKCIEELQEIKETGITIERWERILRTEQLPILRRELYFINPNYEVKFGLRPRRSLPMFRSIPYLRDYYVTAAYYLIGG